MEENIKNESGRNNSGKDNASVSHDVLTSIVEAAIMAPSGDNLQPWYFVIGENQISIYYDEKADQSFFNLNQTATQISCGCVIEIISIVATRYNLHTDIEIDSDNSSNLAAVVKFRQNMEGDEHYRDYLYNYIGERTTNRKFYDRTKISEKVRDEIIKIADPIDDTEITLVTNRKALKRVAKLMYKADVIRVETEELHKFLINAIRFTKSSAKFTKDGLPLKNLELDPMGELVLKLTKSWKVMKWFNRLGLGKLISMFIYLQVLSSSGVALITTKNSDKKSFLNGGRALERSWLGFEEHGMKAQPVAAITFFLYRWRHGDKESFSPKHRKAMEEILKEFNSVFPGFVNDTPIIFYRFGYAKDIKCRTFRKEPIIQGLGQNN